MFLSYHCPDEANVKTAIRYAKIHQGKFQSLKWTSQTIDLIFNFDSMKSRNNFLSSIGNIKCIAKSSSTTLAIVSVIIKPLKYSI